VPRSFALSLLFLAACSTPRAGSTDETTSSRSPIVATSDSATVVRLERESRALARADGCTSAATCRAAPLGSRPCGGPRDYLVYCASTTDSATLSAKLDSLRVAEERWNQARGIASTCEFREPPAVAVQGGSCARVKPE